MRNALVTGGAKRIGKAICETLASDGWSVAVHYNGSEADAAAVADTVIAAGGNAVTVQADLTDEASVRAMAAAARQGLNGLNAVVNNASVFLADDEKTEDRDVWDRHMEAHVRAPFVLTQCLAQDLPPGSDGAVVNVIDQRVINPTKHLVSYSLSKMALWDQTQILARALAPAVRVNAVGPGPVLPGPRQSQADFDLQASQTPLGRSVEPMDIAAAVSYLLDARSVTGQLIAVDAGQHMNWAFETPETAPRE